MPSGSAAPGGEVVIGRFAVTAMSAFAPSCSPSIGRQTAQTRQPIIALARPAQAGFRCGPALAGTTRHQAFSRGVSLPSRRLLQTRSHHSTFRAQAEASSAPIDPSFPEPSAAPRSQLDKVADVLTTLFPVWVCLGAAIGISRPESVAWCSSGLFTGLLGFLMLSMGLTLTFDDFKKCAQNPVPIGVGYLAQYIVKPLLGYGIAKVLNLSPALATGLILVSCCPGGQSSNVATYIAHGDVALSVLMTTASTLGAIIMTPLLTKTLAGAMIEVDAKGLAISTFQVVLVPTLVGVVANEFFHDLVKKFTAWLPLVGVAITTLLCASPCAQVATVLKAEGASLLLPVILLHFCAFTMGYYLSKGLKFNEKTARTVSIETGMQSAALGFALAQKHFSDVMVCVPAAVSVVFMALGGSALAVFWRSRPTTD